MSHKERWWEEYVLREILANSVPAPERPVRYIRPSVDLETPRLSATGTVMARKQAPDSVSPVQSNIRGFTSRINVTNESVMILAADPGRKFLFFQNEDSVGSVRIAFGVDATQDTGIHLPPGGSGILMDKNVPTSAVFVIGSIPSNPNLTMVVA